MHKAISLLPFKLLKVVDFLGQVLGECFIEMICMVEVLLELFCHRPDEIARTNVVLLHLGCLITFRMDKLQKVLLQSLYQLVFGFFILLFFLFLLLLLLPGLVRLLYFLDRGSYIFAGPLDSSSRTAIATHLLCSSKLGRCGIHVFRLKDQLARAR